MSLPLFHSDNAQEWQKDIDELEYLLDLNLSDMEQTELIYGMFTYESIFQHVNDDETLMNLNIQKIDLMNNVRDDHIGKYEDLSLEDKSRYLKVRKEIFDKKKIEPVSVMWLDDHVSLTNWGPFIFANLLDLGVKRAPFYVFRAHSRVMEIFL